MTVTWTMKSGRRILVSEMEDEHLLNSISMLERNKEKGCQVKRKIYFDDGYDGYTYMPDFKWITEIVKGDEYLKMFHYDLLRKEAIKRKLIKK